MRLGGNGENTRVGDIYNKGNAEGKTGWYKIILYAPGHNDIETMVYLSKQVSPPVLSTSMDKGKLYLTSLDAALKAELAAGTATVKLVQAGSGRGSSAVDVKDFTGVALAADNSYDISDIALEVGASYSLSITTNSFAPLAVELTTPASDAGIELNTNALELNVGANATLAATPTPAGTVTWESADSAIASVSATGLITGEAPGSTIVYATANGRTATCAVTVLPTGTGGLIRHSGIDRIETAVKASQTAFPDKTKVSAVVVAYAYRFPDALAASVLAGCVNGPILLSDTEGIDAKVLNEISRLEPSTVYIVGDEKSISAPIKEKLTQLPHSSAVVRLGGIDRYETARLIADEAVRLGAKTDEMFLATGNNFPDALAVSSFAVNRKVPILLTENTTLSTATAAYIQSQNLSKVFVLGDALAVSDGVVSTVVSKGVAAASIQRLSGIDRYATAQDVVEELIPYYNVQPTVVGIATGDNFPDALSGGAALGSRGGVLVITRSLTSELAASTTSALALCKRYNPSVEILGDTKTIIAEAENTIRAHLA
jgi:putative cell wall-binding protein